MHIRDQNNLVRTQVHIADLEAGMTVEVNGEFKTVNVKDHVSHSDFMGWCFQGDASKKYLTRVQFAIHLHTGTVLR